jgi:DNA-directed RNA polymerase subunit RPC12/RpoP
MQQEQQVRIDITQTTPVVCKCGSKIFHEVLLLRKASRFISNLPTDQIIPVGTIACVKCGEIHEESLPPAIKVLMDKEKEYVDFTEETNQ